MEITHKSALFVLRRIRHGVGDESVAKLTGTVEADEVLPRGPPTLGWHLTGGQEEGSEDPVVGVVQRGGDVRLRVMPRVTAAHLREFIAETIPSPQPL